MLITMLITFKKVYKTTVNLYISEASLSFFETWKVAKGFFEILQVTLSTIKYRKFDRKRCDKMKEEINAIGFGIKELAEFKQLSLSIIKDYDVEVVYGLDEENTKVKKIKYFGDDFGIIAYSNIDNKNSIRINSVQPYYETEFIQRLKDLKIQQVDEDVFVAYGVEETSNVMFFFVVQNDPVDLYEERKLILGEKDVKIYGVSNDCKVILANVPKVFSPLEYLSDILDGISGIDSDNFFDIANILNLSDEELEEHMESFENFLSEVNNGFKSGRIDERFSEFLNYINKSESEQEINISNMFERLKEYIHYVGKNKYEFLGTITQVNKETNKKTGMTVYKISLEISGIYIDVIANECELYGMPSVGMRLFGSFKFYGEILKDNF